VASDSRTLKLAILGEVKGLTDSLKKSEKDVETFGDKVEGFSRKAGLAFAAATAAAALYAGKLLKEGVESAIADEQAQAKLAKTLENVTGATNSQIASVEEYILKTSLATGVTDDELRPSLDRLTRSTKDVEDAQRLQTLALDVSAGSGKSLESVTEALAKAYDGNYGALKRLGVPLDDSIIKSKDFDAATKALSSTFKDQASVQADTFEGRMRKLKTALDEAKESVGAALLPELQKLVTYITDRILPQINAFVGGLTGNKGIKNGLEGTASASYDLGTAFRDMASSASRLFSVFNADANTGSSSGLAKVIGWAENIIKVFNKLIDGIAFTMGLLKIMTEPENWWLNSDETVALANKYAGIVTPGPPRAGLRSSNRSSTPMSINFGGTGSVAGAVGAGSGLLGSSTGGTQIATDNSNSRILTNIDKLQADVDKNIAAANKALEAANLANVKADALLTPDASILGYRDSSLTRTEQNIYNVTVNGAVDPIGTARQINNILGREATTNGSFNNLGFSLLVAQ
jgi:hypothetical protein